MHYSNECNISQVLRCQRSTIQHRVVRVPCVVSLYSLSFRSYCKRCTTHYHRLATFDSLRVADKMIYSSSVALLYAHMYVHVYTYRSTDSLTKEQRKWY